jgi:hypothetical protein
MGPIRSKPTGSDSLHNTSSAFARVGGQAPTGDRHRREATGGSIILFFVCMIAYKDHNAPNFYVKTESVISHVS